MEITGLIIVFVICYYSSKLLLALEEIKDDLKQMKKNQEDYRYEDKRHEGK
jgi:hypothetical protein